MNRYSFVEVIRWNINGAVYMTYIIFIGHSSIDK